MGVTHGIVIIGCESYSCEWFELLIIDSVGVNHRM